LCKIGEAEATINPPKQALTSSMSPSYSPPQFLYGIGDTALPGDDFENSLQVDVEVGAKIAADTVDIGAATGQRQQHRRALLDLLGSYLEEVI
jgi:hypothetical protein